VSFRRYVHYCAWCGGIAAYGSWALGRWLTFDSALVLASAQGLLFGFSVGVTLGVVDALWILPRMKVWRIASRALAVGVVGALASMLGGVIADRLPFEVIRLPGWFCTGLLVGVALALPDVVVHRGAGSLGRMRRASVGGALGGFLGGGINLLLSVVCRHFLTDTDPLWSPNAWGTVALGMCMGLGVALAQAPGKEGPIQEGEKQQSATPVDKMIG
jgi:hypothetical protein